MSMLAKTISTPDLPLSGPRTWVSREMWLIVAIASLVALTWWVSRLELFRPESALGYALGATGGTMMLLLFVYPLRKRVPFMQNWGKTRHWFWWHMTLGILGPTIILFHSGYYFGSLNATMAFCAMVCVAISGVLGRFVYARIHHGLYGRRSTLKEMQTALGFVASHGHSIFSAVPSVESRLKNFEVHALKERMALARAWHFLTMPFQIGAVRRACFKEIARSMHGESASKTVKEAVVQYLGAIGRVAQFRTFERTFALWHVLHVPLVWMLVLCAIAHVIAVHIY